jgi:hypothetical protein
VGTPTASSCSTGSPIAFPSSTLIASQSSGSRWGDGHEALLVNGGGIDGGNGAYFANAGEELHAVGSLAPIVEGFIGCIVIKQDGSRYVAPVPDPL